MKEIILDMPSPELSELNSFIHEQFDCMYSLCKFLEEAIRKEAKRRQAWARRQLTNCEGEEEKGFNSVFIDDSLFEVKRDFPRIVRYSLLVSMMSTTESCLIGLCRVARNSLNITVEFQEKGNDVIQRALKYLGDEAGLDTSRMGYRKKLADNLRNLRNTIVHEAGCIKGRKDEPDIRVFANSGAGVEIDKGNNIVLADRFVMNNTKGMQELVIQLHGKPKKQIAAQHLGSGLATP
ncbi:MAG: hypothetical protein H0X47_20340 [Nitrospirales bacterium]|nr:hypothetical protein [Nitrospirales bacterium]